MKRIKRSGGRIGQNPRYQYFFPLIKCRKSQLEELANRLIRSDIILKSQQEADYYKEKIGSVVRDAFKV